MKPACTARKADGSPCGAAPLHESTMCFLHDPATKAEAAEARRLGGLLRRRESTIAAAYDLESLDHVTGIRRVVEIAIADTVGLENGVARNRTFLAGGRVLAKLLRVGELETRIETLELALLRRHPPAVLPVDATGDTTDEQAG